MIFVSGSLITLVPRFWRMYLALWLISRCRLPATPALTLPVAVILKRFLAPDLVFNFGISSSVRRKIRAALACLWPGGSTKARLLRERPRKSKTKRRAHLG